MRHALVFAEFCDMFQLAAMALVLGSAAAVLVVLALGSIVFLSTLLLVVALMLRKRWDDIGDSHTRRR